MTRKRSERQNAMAVTNSLILHARGEDWRSLDEGVRLLWERVAKGDHEALCFVRDMLDGRPTNSLRIGMEDEAAKFSVLLTDAQRAAKLSAILHLARSREAIDITPDTDAEGLA